MSQIAYTIHENDDQGYPLTNEIRIANDGGIADKIFRIMLHEFGHTIRFGHLTDRAYIMFNSAPLPSDIHPDELWMLDVYEALPNTTDMVIYNSSLIR